ncbi:oligopeptide transporter [Myriangium duriaei CBS 260.36]|uniref:Oligopeptide transporter n=1 Tax=Myriangium duriaei CBS 260.36 TaxID=1168546 RepID=A0A9P4IU47_9PEZI|nr:oligopeptide transporter [Myriangium duriaei CBS 260.36]
MSTNEKPFADAADIQPDHHFFQSTGHTNVAVTGNDRISETLSEKDHAIIDEKEDHDEAEIDPFVPFHDLPDERATIVTVRAIVVGCVCGAAVNASNVYLGLKTGWTFTANLFGAIVGFAVLKSLSRVLPNNFPILGGTFGPRENNIVQTAATAAGGLSSVFISGIPALYQLDLLTTPTEDFKRLITLTLCGAYFGFAFATPLRKFFIIYVARELRLVFPTPFATATTIKSMHLAVGGEAVAKLKMKALGIAFSGAMLLRVVSQYATGILWDWHFFTWFYIWAGHRGHAIDVENWGWFLEFTPAFIGSGMLVGLNTSISFFMGSFLAWGVIGPTLVKYNVAFGKAVAPTTPGWEDYISYASMSKTFSTKDHPSARFWMLWPGVLLMIAVAFTELFLQYKVFFFICKAMVRAASAWVADYQEKRGKPNAALRARGQQVQEDIVHDPAAERDQVPFYWWLPILVLSIICSCVVLGVQFQMPVGMSLLSVFLAFFFAFLAIQCAGVTDITPLTAASKASQIVLGGATKGEHWTVTHAQRLNLLGGSLASMGANQSSDLVSDFRVGFLLKTPPKQQWIAQCIGTIVAVFLAPGMFILFTKAYPCIITGADECPFSAPSVAAWKATAVAVTDPVFPVPKSSGIFAIVLAIFGVFMVLVRTYAYKGKWEKYRAYHPNMMCIGLAFVLPQTQYGTAMVIGSAIVHFWVKRNPHSFDIYGFAIAAGLIAGEGIGGVINAIFQIAGIGGDKYGSNIACPADSC